MSRITHSLRVAIRIMAVTFFLAITPRGAEADIQIISRRDTRERETSLPGVKRGEHVVNTVRVLFTSDLHSPADRYPQIVSYVNSERERAEAQGYTVITLDAGDIAMGTHYSALTEIDAPEYRALALMGCDAYVFGNHDFDLGVKPLAYMFYNARLKENAINPVTGENLTFPTNITANVAAKKDDKVFGNALKYIGKTPYKIYQKDKLKIGVFGVLGKDAYDSILCKEDFLYEDPVKIAKAAIKELKAKGVDFIICVSHGGSLLREKSEDALLAKECPEIDLLISGHDHCALFSPFMVGNVPIVAAGTGGYLLGEADLLKGADKKLISYKLKQIPADTPPDAAAQILLDSLDKKLKVIFHKRYYVAPYTLLSSDYPGLKMGVDSTGKNAMAAEIAKSIFYAAGVHSTAEPDTSRLVAIVPAGLIRASLPEGELTYADAFKVLSLGRDAKGNLGYPLVVAYVTGKELERICELNAATKKPDLNISFYGLTFTYNPAALPFFRVKNVYVHGEKVEKKALYPVVTDLYTATSLDRLKNLSHSLIKVVPKKKDGTEALTAEDLVLTSKEDNYISAPSMSEWFCFARYIAEEIDVPDSYLQPAGIPERSGAVYLLYALFIVVGVAIVAVVIKLLMRAFRGRGDRREVKK